MLEKFRGNHIVILSNKFEEASQFANKLVFAYFPFVSILHDGLKEFQSDLLVKKQTNQT